MLQATRKWIAPVLAVLAVAAIQAPSAKAAFTLTVQEDAGTAFAGAVISIAGPLDGSSNPDTITALTTALNSALTYFQFGSLSSASSGPDGTPGSNDVASLTQTGAVVRTNDNSNGLVHTLTIIASDDTFSFPVSNPKEMRTSAGGTFNNTTAGDGRTFQSIFDATGSGGGLVSTSLGAFTFTPGVGAGPFSPSNPDLVTPLGSQTTPFTLTNITVITLGANGPGTTNIQQAQFTGGTTVQTVVAEPSSMALGLISLPALLALGRRMRRRADV
ncbi:MAG: hypothetical protein P4L85_01170 [Paludisphaera borealis]|uniref:hypothetical protein n=1 Tax=Paludisphaera borealis TaxID=1387353 RepID=UPI00284D6CAE|nr:hypothetical protein [Paludisphaera borealis]MDR3617931.1 hypothetical protein [Paludisphaera borealis]